jgi:hypothetical protein
MIFYALFQGVSLNFTKAADVVEKPEHGDIKVQAEVSSCCSGHPLKPIG